MNWQVRLKDKDKVFAVESGETILDAGLRQGVGLPYGCRDGACGSCKGKVVQGDVEHRAYQKSALSDNERSEGYALFCSAVPQSDLVVDVRTVDAAGDIQIRKLPCRVVSLDRLAPDVVALKLQLPTSERFQFLAGQYVDLILKNGSRRSYSMACAPHAEGPLEFHVRHMPGGYFTDALFAQSDSKLPAVKQRDIFRLEGPLGSFFLREDDRPLIFLASGTGFAPIKSILETMIAQGIRRPTHLYWGGRRPIDIYHLSLVQGWVASHDWLSFVPVVSDALAEDGWHGRTGFVHRAVVEDWPDLSAHAVYACGAPIVVSSARRDFVEQCRLDPEQFFADVFTSEADRPDAGDQTS